MLLPLLIIFLVLICAYLEYQKKISLHNKIFVCIICVIVFVLCYSFMKKYDKENFEDIELQTHEDYVSTEEENVIVEEEKEKPKPKKTEPFKEGFKNNNKKSKKPKKEKFLGKLHCFPDPNTKKPKESFLERYYNTKKKTGYSYVPDMFWTLPERRPPVCIPQQKSNPSAVMHCGAGKQALEFEEKTGFIATTEDNVKLTNVGSILPKFKFTETYDPKDY